MASDYVTVLTAKYIDGQSIAQIVSEIGGTAEGVRSRLARARRDFKLRFVRLSENEPEQVFFKGN
jgi:RNA polymerase sigma-70 factor (ECF subfamily)